MGLEDAAAALLLGLAEGQSRRQLPSPTLADTVKGRGVLPLGGPPESAWEEDFGGMGGEQCIAQFGQPAYSPLLSPPFNFALGSSQLRSLGF